MNTENSQNIRTIKKKKRSLRKKLYAALSMLLVCAILLTTTTYAWLSLSVAPSVDKVKTTITGNGSLEVALATADIIKNLDLIDDFESLTGFDSEGNYDANANTNWGNLVDLSDDRYGLSLLKLYPALLNIVGDKVGENPLRIANFGADGRVTYLNSDTTSAMFDTNTHSFLLNGETDFGVRALGVSTSTGLWDALEIALRATKKDGEGLLKEKIQVKTNSVNINATIGQYVELMSMNQGLSTVNRDAFIAISEKIVGTEPVEATETTEAVEGTDGIIDKLDRAVRNLILACSGYSDKYVSITADEMIEIAEGEMSTVEIIEKYVLSGTDLANLCGYYVTAAEQAERVQEFYDILLTKSLSDTGTYEDMKTFAEPIFGDSFKVYYTAWINRTAKVEKTVTAVENGETVEKTVTETVVTHDGDIISADTLAELDAKIAELKNPAADETEVVSCTASNKTKNIEIQDTDNLIAAMAQIAGTMSASTTSVDINGNFFGKPVLIFFPCNTEKSAIDQLSSVEREFAYQENLFTLQTMWNQLDIHRNALAEAIDGEMKALIDVVRRAVLFEDNNAVYEEFEAIRLTDPDRYDHDMSRMENYVAPQSADHETLQKHIDTMQDALDFYYDFTVQAALTYASKDTTYLDTYIQLKTLLDTEENERTIPLADILNAVGDGFASQYAAALSSYNAAQTAVKNAQQKLDAYNTNVEEEIKAAEKNGTTPAPHPTWQEDLELRSAFTDTDVFADYITTTEETSAWRPTHTYADGGMVYDLEALGLGRYPRCSYSDKYGFSYDFASSDPAYSREDPVLFEAWVEMVGRTAEGAAKFNEIVRPLVCYYDPNDGSSNYDIFSVHNDIDWIGSIHTDYQAYDADELFAMGYPAKESYDQYDVNYVRTAYNKLNRDHLPKANNFIRATVEYYLSETGLIYDDGITITDTQGNVVTTTTVKTVLKGIVDTVFADYTKPMADRLEAELKTAIGTVPYAEFRMYAGGLMAAISTENDVWADIMAAAVEYDAVLAQNTALDSELDKLKALGAQDIMWEEISVASQIVTGELDGYISSTTGYYYYYNYTFWLSEDNMFEDLVALYSDKFEYETYNRGGTWRYVPYNVEQGPLPELKLGLIKYGAPDWENWEQEERRTERLFVFVQPENGHGGYITAEERSVGTSRDYFLRADGNFAPDNGITPLYNLAVNNSKSVQTDRSLMFRQLVKDMMLAKTTAEDSKAMMDLQTLGEYIAKTMYRGSYPIEYTTLHNASAKFEDVLEYIDERLPKIESYTYDEVEMLITALDSVTKGMDSYKASLRTSFMLWAASANGTKDAYKAVAANYTGTIDDMMASANLKEGNLYFDTYSTVQDILARVQQSRELLVTLLADKPETVTETDVIEPAALKQALTPLASDVYYNVTGTDLFLIYKINHLALCSDDSVLGKVYGLYAPDSAGNNYVNYYPSSSLYMQFNAPSTNMMQRAINTAIEGGITFDANVSAASTASAILSDSYAFAIDLLLRTNAVDSNLLLQTEEKQRIYDEEFGAVETMGKGSFLKYNLTNATTQDQLDAINNCVRVVFTDTTTGEILACAKPDKLVIPDMSYEEIYGDKQPSEDEEIKFVGYLHLCDYVITDSGILYTGEKLDNSAIMPLEKNKTTPVTVYVYLDGNEMGNSVASGTADINFDMNLQFSSDAELIPAQGTINVS